jgi:hypothetical protein
MFDLTPFLAPGVNNLNIQLTPGFDDALSLVAAGVAVPAGSAPQPSAVPEPATLSLFGVALAASGLFRMRSKRNAS